MAIGLWPPSAFTALCIGTLLKFTMCLKFQLTIEAPRGVAEFSDYDGRGINLTRPIDTSAKNAWLSHRTADRARAPITGVSA